MNIKEIIALWVEIGMLLKNNICWLPEMKP